METQLKWAGNAAFVGKASSGHTVVMDGPAEGGGRNLGPRPMEMLILGMGACSTYDVVSILKKSRQEITDCEIKITSQRADSDPKRAIKLSAEKYCSASIMLGKTANITHDFEIINVD